MVEIRRVKLFKPRYAVTDSRGAITLWQGRLGREGAAADIDGHAYAVRRDGRKRFVLKADGRELAAAERAGRVWKVSSAGASYELARRSVWRSTFELRAGDGTVGTISRKRRNVLCELPADLPLTVQAFLGFVAIALWSREAAASSGGSAGAVATTGA
jgi:hypothetical protein